MDHYIIKQKEKTELLDILMTLYHDLVSIKKLYDFPDEISKIINYTIFENKELINNLVVIKDNKTLEVLGYLLENPHKDILINNINRIKLIEQNGIYVSNPNYKKINNLYEKINNTSQSFINKIKILEVI